MKTFKEFITEAEITEILSILIEAKAPSYSDEHAGVNVYNYLVGSGDKRRRLGRQMRAAIAAGDNETIRQIASRELEAAQTDPSHPLHFDNASDEGFSGKAGKTDAHRDDYNKQKRESLPGFLAQVASRAGRSIASQGWQGTVKGAEHLEAEPDWTGNTGGQGRRDLEFRPRVARNRGDSKKVHGVSQKKGIGSQAMSAGGDQTAATFTAAGKEVARRMMPWTRRRKNPDESPEDYQAAMTREKLAARERGRAAVSDVQSRASDIGAALDSTRGKSIEDQKPTVADVSSRINDLERDYPGIKRAAGQEAITGKAQYGNRGRVHSVFTSGVEDSSLKDPRQQEVGLRPRGGKSAGRPSVVAGDIAPAKRTKKQQQARQSDYLTHSKSSGSI